MNQRFTIDGSDALEQRLDSICREVSHQVQRIVPPSKLEGLVLGGGYGRGEGGVLKTDNGDELYNDLEIYVFLRGNRLLNSRRYERALNILAHHLSLNNGLHIEFKCDSLQRLKRSPISMFTYDLVAGHHVVSGEPEIFHDCGHHLDARGIPLSEATRLLFNRCSGLLLVREKLSTRSGNRPGSQQLSGEDSDFIGRNLAKAQLALGDAILAVQGKYHWSCRERNRRLSQLSLSEPLADFAKIKKHHDSGVAFKLHPWHGWIGEHEFEGLHRELSRLSSELWLWLESIRLQEPFFTPRDYSLYGPSKCPESPAWRNFLLNLKTFGLKAMNDTLAWRYPRERLFNALTLLLWEPETPAEPMIQSLLQKQLHTAASDWAGWVAAYKNLWPGYG
jgi:hypothetical protein